MDSPKKVLAIGVAIFFIICLMCIIAIILGLFDNINFFSKEQDGYTRKTMQQSNIVNMK